MEFYIQQGNTPAYKFCYFEYNSNKYYAEMVNLNEFVGQWMILPRILFSEVKIHPCLNDWTVEESETIGYFHSSDFSQEYFKACLEQFITNHQQT